MSEREELNELISSNLRYPPRDKIPYVGWKDDHSGVVIDVDWLSYAILARYRLVPIRQFTTMRAAIADELLNISSHRDEINGIDLPGDWFTWAYEWEE